MKKLLIFCLTFGTLFSSGCVNRYFKYTVNLNSTGVWRINQTGAFNSNSFLTGSFNIPNDADILEINIESLTLTPNVRVGHTATSVTAQGTLQDPVGVNHSLFPQQTLSLTGLEWIPDRLIQAGVAKLKQLFSDAVKGKSFPSGYRLILAGTISGGQAVIDINYTIRGTVKYGRCEEVLEVMGDLGEPCIGSGIPGEDSPGGR